MKGREKSRNSIFLPARSFRASLIAKNIGPAFLIPIHPEFFRLHLSRWTASPPIFQGHRLDPSQTLLRGNLRGP